MTTELDKEFEKERKRLGAELDKERERREAKRKAEQFSESLATCGLVLLFSSLLACPFVSCVAVVYIVAEAAVRMAGQ